jgi:hypothetical protein
MEPGKPFLHQEPPPSLLTKASAAFESLFKLPKGAWNYVFWAAFALISLSCFGLLIVALLNSSR